MPKQFEGEMCVLCRARPSSPTGEHVWPRWLLLEMFRPVDGPYSWWKSGTQVVKRDGLPREHASVGGVKLPVCVECNSILDRRFEKSAKRPIRLLMAQDGDVVFAGTGGMVMALWFLKTWLLLAHPAARESDPDVTPARWDSVPEELYSWLVTDQPPPAGFSIWVTRRAEEGPEPAAIRRIPLPTVVADGRSIKFRAKRAGVRLLDVSLVYHPGWEIEHPLEVEGRALRLWPRTADTEADFASLPTVHPKDTTWLKGPTLYFLPGVFGRGDLPRLSPSFNPLDLLPRFVSQGGW